MCRSARTADRRKYDRSGEGKKIARGKEKSRVAPDRLSQRRKPVHAADDRKDLASYFGRFFQLLHGHAPPDVAFQPHSIGRARHTEVHV
jgi:hypothetical protein